LRTVTPETRTGKVGLLVITSNRGLAGAYNGSVLRAAMAFIREQESAGNAIELYVAGKKGASYFNYQKRPMKSKQDARDVPAFDEVRQVAEQFMKDFTEGRLDAVHVAFMNFISTGSQKPVIGQLLPLSGVVSAAEKIAQEAAEKEAQHRAGALDARRSGADVKADEFVHGETVYDFSPSARELLDELLPQTVKVSLFQAFLDATTSEHVARMVAMKSATDNADKMAKALTMQYNRARQSQITTELSEIMGGVEAMKG
jgi:F-type H+-transporting ATPase subunit gamma